jgi:hypothetical protein
MDVQATLTRAANLAEIAHRELSELSYDPPAWEVITNAAKVSPLVDATIQLKAAPAEPAAAGEAQP